MGCILLRNLVFLISAFSLIGCSNGDTIAPNPGGGGAVDQTGAVYGAISSGATKVAYAYSIGLDSAKVYIPSADRFAEIDLTTGQYYNDNSQTTLCYSGAGCTGTAATYAFSGKAGKTIIFDGTNYLLAGAVAPAIFVHASSKGASGCAAIVGSSPFPMYSMSVTVRPYDFTPIAPINIVFE